MSAEMKLAAGIKTEERRHDIDWLRTLASYLIVFYHTAQFFDLQNTTYIKNEQLSSTIEVFTRFVYIWHMPLFFLLAGWSTKTSLGRRGPKRFFLERAHRLLLPLLFGMVIWCAPPRWVDLKHGLFRTTSGERVPAQPTIKFSTFLKEYYFTPGGITWGHLWFLIYLFAFSALYLPGFFIISEMEVEQKWFQGWGGWVLANAPVIPLVVIQVTLRDRWPGFQNLTDDWANFGFYSTFFVTGYCLAQFPALESHLHESWGLNCTVGILTSVLTVVSAPSFEVLQIGSFYRHVFSALAGWFMVLSWLSYFRYGFSGRAPPSLWASRAFPVYIIHDVPLALLVDGLLPSLGAPILVKFLLISCTTLILSFFLLKRLRLLQILVGMKSERPVLSFKKEVVSKKED